MTFKFWAVAGTLAIMLSSELGTGVAASTGNPQIQGASLRIEFDHNLRSRVVARFDNKETAMGPFTASESVTAADKAWTEFPLTSEKHERVSDAFGKGERLTVTGKSGTLTKSVSVTMYDEFPAMAFFASGIVLRRPFRRLAGPIVMRWTLALCLMQDSG